MIKPKVLVVEDDQRWLRIYQRGLSETCEIIVAETIEAGERLFAETQDVVLIIMDACVPGDEPTTLELTRKIRDTFKGPMIGASSLPEYRTALSEAGCDHLVAKGEVIDKTNVLLGLPV